MGKDSPYCKCLLFSANALARMITRMADEAFAATGVSYSHGFLLMLVNKAPGMPIGEASEYLMLAPSTVTRLVEKLEEKGLLQRHSEGRTSRLFPTDASLALDPALKQAWRSVFDRYKTALGNEPVEPLTDSIYKAAKLLEEQNAS